MIIKLIFFFYKFLNAMHQIFNYYAITFDIRQRQVYTALMNKKVLSVVVILLSITYLIFLAVTPRWKIYESDELGFSVQYPSDWKLETYDDGINLISPTDQKLLEEADRTGGHLGRQNKSDIFSIRTYPYIEREKHLTHWKREKVIVGGLTVYKVTAYGPDSSSEFVQMINGGDEYLITFPTDKTRIEILESFKFTAEKDIENTAYWKSYSNEKFGFKFKYPEIYNILTKDPITNKYSSSTEFADNLFVTGATEYSVNNIGKEYGGIELSILDKPFAKPSEIISKKEVKIDGCVGTLYTANDGMEGTRTSTVLFENNGKYFRITEWSSNPLLEHFISTIKFQ